MSNAPHWKDLLREMWEVADHETFTSINLRDYCAEHDYSEVDVANVLEVMPAWEYVEWGVSPMYPWFCKELDI